MIDKVSGPARGIAGALGRIDKQVGRFNKGNLAAFGMGGFGGRLLAMGAGYVGVTEGMRGTVGAAISFESAFAGVRKVVQANEEQFGNMRRQIIGMPKELPITAEGIAEIYAAAGASDVPIQELSKFTEMVAKVSTAWEMPVNETGQALAEIKNQLHLNIGQTGLLADALNHLDNNTAARSRNLLDYTKRVAGTGEMYGFTATQTLAFGGAMISSGAEAEVAATSYRNMGRALTIGARATKMQRTAFKRLGIDSVKTAKNMQKNALETTLDVIDRIQKLPEWERASMASALFGDEARALMPVINNATELRRQLALLANETNYSGSAFKEYTERAKTTGTVLAILKNKIADGFRSSGDDMLPWIKEGALGIGDVLDTLGERAGVFDKLGAGMRGFVQGLGFDGGIRAAMNSLGDLLFGAKDGGGAADRLGEIFMKAKGWGAAIRELSDAIKGSPIAGFLATLGSYGATFAVAAIGMGLLAGAIRRLGSALLLLSGAKFAFGLLKQLGSLTKWAHAADAVTDAAGELDVDRDGKKRAGRPKAGGKLPRFKLPFGIGFNLPTVLTLAAAELTREVIEQTSSSVQAQNLKPGGRAVIAGQGDAADIANRHRQNHGQYFEAGGFHRVMSQGDPMPNAPQLDVAAQLRSVTLQARSTGVADVHVTNQPPFAPPPISLVINVANAMDAPAAAANAVGDAIANAVQSVVAGHYADGAN